MDLRILGILLFFVFANVNAQGIPPNVEKILRQTIAANGYLTQQMHQEFWNEVRSLGAPSEIQLLKRTLNINVLGAQEFQKEIWLSAKKSYENNMVVKTDRLVQLERELPIIFEQSIPYPEGSPDYKEAMTAYKQRSKVSMENAVRLLDAAAKRSSMTSAQGEVVTLNLDMINTVLANINKSFLRVRNLLDEEWNGE